MLKKVLLLSFMFVGSVLVFAEDTKTYVLSQEEVDERVNFIKTNNQERFDYMIANFDEDKDGKISFAEFDKVRNDKEFNESRNNTKQYKNRKSDSLSENKNSENKSQKRLKKQIQKKDGTGNSEGKKLRKGKNK